MQRETGHLGRIQDTHVDHVAEFPGSRIVTVVAISLGDPVKHHRCLFTGVGHYLAQRFFQGAYEDRYTRLLVIVLACYLGSGIDCAYQRNATAGHHALFDRGPGGVQCVFDTRLLLLHLHFGGGADLDDGYTAGQFGYAFLQFLPVVVGRRLFDLGADLVDPAFDALGPACAVDDGRVFLTDLHALGAAQVIKTRLLQR